MEGKAAMIYDANVFKSLYENPKESKVAGKVGYAVIPAGPAGSVPHVSNWSLSINKNSDRPSARRRPGCSSSGPPTNRTRSGPAGRRSGGARLGLGLRGIQGRGQAAGLDRKLP